MDYLGAEISKKIKSAIRAKLVELGVYVDDELPDYIMVLVANKKTKKQMENDLALFLSDHTAAFVEWLQQVLDKLQTITLQSKEKAGDSDEKVSKGGTSKEREKKRKSSDVGSDVVKKGKMDDNKEKERKRSVGDSHRSKKDKDKESRSCERDLPKKREKSRSREKPCSERAPGREREVGSDGGPARRRPDPAEPTDGRRHPRVSAPPAAAAATAAQRRRAAADDDDQDEDVLSLSAEEDELVKEAGPPHHSSAVAPAPASPAGAASTSRACQTAAAASAGQPPAVTAAAAAGRMVNLRQEATLTSRRVTASDAPPARCHSRSPVRRREVKVTGTEPQPQPQPQSQPRPERPARRGPQSTVGAVVSREEDDTEYDPLNPAVGAVASTVRVTERPRRPASQQPRPTLLLKAMRDAQQSTVASIRPFLVRAQTEPTSPRHKKELFTASLSGRQRRPPATLTPARSRAVHAHSGRSGSPGQIAVTVRNAAVDESVGRRRRRLISPAEQCARPPPESVPMEESVSDTRPVEPSSDEEDTVHVTIGEVKARPRQPEPSEVAERARPAAENKPAGDDISAIVHAVADQIKNRSPSDRAPSPTFVVTMTGLGASRFARSLGADQLAEDSAASHQDLVEEEEEEEEDEDEELEEADLRQQLLEDRARRRVPFPAVAAPADLGAPIRKPVTRCRFWPSCKLGTECSYHHPSVPCKTFPACKFGDLCLYVHPRCRFDGSCSRADCRFSHSGPRPAAPAVTSLGAGTGRPGQPPVAAECKFFPNCTNPTCPFIHPKMCRYADACTNPSCLFAHPNPAPAAGKPQFKWVAPGSI